MIGTPARPFSNDLPPWLALGVYAVCWLALLGGIPCGLSPTGLPWARYLRGPDMGGGVGGLLGTLRHPVNSYERPVSPTASNPVTERVNLSNGRGDIVAQSDVAGTLTWTASYEAYGKRTLELGSNEDRQRANTKEEDPTGLLDEGFRYRDLETGVWLSRDPAGFVDGPNLYAYVRQNPWTAFDPDGLKTKKDYQKDYDAAKKTHDRLGKVDIRKMTPKEAFKHGLEYLKAGQEMKKAQEGINKIESTAKEVNQSIDAINWVRRTQGNSEIPFHVDSDNLDDENPDHQSVFDVSSNWATAKDKAASTLLSLAAAGGGKLISVLKARGAVPGMTKVTSWADEGITPDLNPGRWVQLGDPTKWNFFKTGLGGPKIYRTDQFPFFTKQSSRVPFANSVTDEVPASSLQWPSGWEKIKGMLGQRQIKE